MEQEKEQIVPQLIPIVKNTESVKNMVLTNIIKILTERKLLDKANIEKNIMNITENKPDNNIYKIALDNNEPNTEKKEMYIYVIPYKVSSIQKTTEIGDFLNEYKSYPKILVITNISYKNIFNIKMSKVYPYTEIFLEKELMINIIDHISVPKHELLTDAEMKDVLESYNAKRREIPEILVTDPIARYYNAKHGQMFKIIRPSETAGYVPYYRLVVKGNIIQI
jgi:DNA-directed RNA polymerase subunit H (RpoH/RPB5)